MLSPDGLSFLGAFAKLGKVTVRFVTPVCLSFPQYVPSAQKNAATSGQIFMKFNI
jgi:hypothetical protein